LPIASFTGSGDESTYFVKFEQTIMNVCERLEGRKWSQELSRAAVGVRGLSSIESNYHAQNARSPVAPDVFLSKFKHMPDLLSEYGFQLYSPPSPTKEEDEERHKLCAEYDNYCKTRRPNRYKSYYAINHDIILWQTVRNLRGRADSILDVGSFFLSADYFFYGFDWGYLRDKNHVGVVVMPNQFLQVLRPFIHTTDEINQRFVETFALPQFRTIENDYSQVYSQILSYFSIYSDISERTASRILADQYLIEELSNVKPESEEFYELIENALAEDNERLLAANEEISFKYQEIEKELKEKSGEWDNEKDKLENRVTRAEQIAYQAEERIHEIEQKKESEKQRGDRIEEAFNDTLSKERRHIYIIKILASFITILIGIGICLMPKFLAWNWLFEKPNVAKIYLLFIILIFAIIWAINDRKRRRYALGSIGVDILFNHWC